MRGLCIFIGLTVVSSLGWWLGSFVGFGTAFALSSVGSILGVYAGWRIHEDHFG